MIPSRPLLLFSRINSHFIMIIAYSAIYRLMFQKIWCSIIFLIHILPHILHNVRHESSEVSVTESHYFTRLSYRFPYFQEGRVCFASIHVLKMAKGSIMHLATKILVKYNCLLCDILVGQNKPNIHRWCICLVIFNTYPIPLDTSWFVPMVTTVTMVAFLLSWILGHRFPVSNKLHSLFTSNDQMKYT